MKITLAVALIMGAAVIAHLPSKTVVYVAEAKVVEPSVEVVWTPEAVEAAILEVFPDAPIMVRVARCESSLIPDAHNAVTVDSGIFQISHKYHGERLEELGLDPFDVRDNLTYARMLYDANGLRDWSASKRCWSK